MSRDGLLEDLDALAHLQQADVVSVVEVAVLAGDDVEVEAVVDAVRGGAADVVVDARGPQHGAGRRVVDRLLARSGRRRPCSGRGRSRSGEVAVQLVDPACRAGR